MCPREFWIMNLGFGLPEATENGNIWQARRERVVSSGRATEIMYRNGRWLNAGWHLGYGQ